MVASRERECSAPFKVEVPNTPKFDKRTQKNYIIIRTTVNPINHRSRRVQ